MSDVVKAGERIVFGLDTGHFRSGGSGIPGAEHPVDPAGTGLILVIQADFVVEMQESNGDRDANPPKDE